MADLTRTQRLEAIQKAYATWEQWHERDVKPDPAIVRETDTQYPEGIVAVSATPKMDAELVAMIGEAAAYPIIASAFHLPGKHDQKSHGHGGYRVLGPNEEPKFEGGSPKWTREQRQVLNDYTAQGYTGINHVLRHPEDFVGYDNPEFTKDLTRRADELRGLMRPTAEPFEVARKTDFSQFGIEVDEYTDVGQDLKGQLKQLQGMTGQTVVDKGFVSTTLNPRAEDDWVGNVHMKIRVPTGTDAVYTRGDDRELILRDGTKFEIRSVTPPKGPITWDNPVDVVLEVTP